MGLIGLAMAALVLSLTHDPHGCPEAPHPDPSDCRCERGGDFSQRYPYSQPISYYQPRLNSQPRRYYGYGSYFLEDRGLVVRERPRRGPGSVVYVDGPPIYVDAPPVFVEPAQVYIERPQIVVRPSEVIVAPPDVHFESCPQGADCRQMPPETPGRGH